MQSGTSRSLIVFVILFAAIGGVTLFRSYAATDPSTSLNPGVYDLTDFDTDAPDTFHLSLSKSMKYCLSPTVSIDGQAATVTNGKYSQQVKLTPEHGNIECFTVDHDYTKIDLKLPQEIGQPTSLRASPI